MNQLRSRSILLIGHLLFIGISCFNNAYADEGYSNDPAKAGQNIQNRLNSQVQVPLSYNYNQQLGADNKTRQNQFTLSPIIPAAIGKDVEFILNPTFTYNNNMDGSQLSHQQQPLQFSTYFISTTPILHKDLYMGIGPYLQTPASNSNNGSRQFGAGLSAGVFYAPDKWVIGGTFYNSWGIGNDMSGGSANAFSAQPIISYTTPNAWTYNLSSQLLYNYNTHNTANQLTLSGGQTFRFFGYNIQYQVGPTYMISSTQQSSKGWGGYAALTLLLPK